MMLATDFVLDASLESLEGFRLMLVNDGTDLRLLSLADGRTVKSQSLADSSGVVFIIGSENDETLAVDASAATLSVTFDGRNGKDSLLGPCANSTWSITGDGYGTLNGHVRFSSIENLMGAADNEDTFVFATAGAIGGVVDGGHAGFDTLVIQGGTYNTVTFTASSPSAGSVILDSGVIAYAGLEPITMGGDIANMVIDLGPLDFPLIPLYSSDEATLKDRAGVAGELTFESSSLLWTFETLYFTNPHNSLTIRLGGGDDILHIDTLDDQFAASLTVEGQLGDDAVFIEGNLSLPGENLSIDAETIGVGFAIGQPSEAAGWTPNATYEDVAPSGTSGTGSGMQVTIVVDDRGVPAVIPQLRGDDYQVGDSVTFSDPGGTGDPVTLTVSTPGDLGVTVSTRSAVGDAGTIQFGGFNHADVDHTTYEGAVEIATGDKVLIVDPFLINGFTGVGDVGNLYQYVGAVSPRTIDLRAEDFTDASQWDDLGPAVSSAQMARNIIVGQHSQLRAEASGTSEAGAVLLEVEAVAGTDAFDMLLANWDTSDVGIAILEGAQVYGGNVVFEAAADHSRIIDGEGAGHAILNGLLRFIESLDLIGGVAISKTDARIEIAKGSAIRADEFRAIAEATSNAYAAPIALTAAVAVAIADTRANVTIAGNITTTGDVYIRAGADNTLDARADASALLAGAAVGVAVTVLDSNATALVTDDAVLHVGRDLVVHADTVDRNVTLAQSTAGTEGFLGVATAVSDEESYTNALLDGHATVAGNVTVEALQRKEAIEGRKLLVVPALESGVAATAGVGMDSHGDLLDDTQAAGVTWLLTKLKEWIKGKSDQQQQEGQKSKNQISSFDLSAGVAVVDCVSSATARIGDGQGDARGVVAALLGSIDVHAKVESRPDITSGSASATPTGQQPSVEGSNPNDRTKFGGSAAVAVGDYDNTARAYIGAGAQVDAQQDLTVKAEALNDYEFEWFANLVPEGFVNPAIDHTTDEGIVTVKQGDMVRIKSGFGGTGAIGHAYQYVGNSPLTVDLAPEDFTDDSRWADEGALSVDHYSADGLSVVQDGDLVRVSKGHKAGGDAPDIYKYVGNSPGATIDLSAEDYSDTDNWESLGPGAWKQRSLAFVQNLTSYLDDNLGLDNNAVDSWSQSTATGADISVAGSVTVLSLDQIAEAYIDQHALINQNTVTVPRTGEQDVVVAALSIDEAVHFAGNIELPGLAGDTKKFTINPSFGGLGTQGGKAAVGATVLIVTYADTVKAEIRDGVHVYADSLNVDADNRAMDVTVAASGGKAKDFGFNGVFSLCDFQHTTWAQIDNGAQVSVAAGVVAGDPDSASVAVTATDDARIYNIAGGVAAAQGIGVGAAVAINDITRDTRALVGNRNLPDAVDHGVEAGDADTADKPGAGTKTIDTDGKVKVAARNTGVIVAPSLSAAVASDKVGNNEQAQDAPEEGGKFGLGISANVSINEIDDMTLAYVHDAAVEATDVIIKANEASSIWAIGGSVSIASTGSAATVSLAGAYAQNDLSLETLSFVDNSGVTLSGSLVETAVSSGMVISVGVSGSVATKPPLSQDGNPIAIAGQVSKNRIDKQTEAAVLNQSDINAGQVNLFTRDGSTIFAVAGAISFGGKAGIGAAVAVNDVVSEGASPETPGVRSHISQSDVHAVDSLTLNATTHGQITGVTAGISGSINTGGSFALAATVTVVINTIDVSTAAFIEGRKSTGIEAGGSITLSAADTSHIDAFSGSLAIAAGKGPGAVGLGAAAAVNKICSDVNAWMRDTTVLVSGGIDISATSTPSIQALSVAGAGGGAFGEKSSGALMGAGAGARNEIHGALTATIDSCHVEAAGDISLKTDDHSCIGAVGIGAAFSVVAGGGGAAISVGLSFGRNEIDNQVTACIDEASVTSAYGGIQLLVDESATIRVTAVAASVGAAGGTGFSLSLTGGGADAVNAITTKANAYAQDSTLSGATDVDITTDSRARIEATVVALGVSLAGSNSNAGAVGIGASRARNYIGKTLDGTDSRAQAQAYVKDSGISAGGDLTVTATAKGVIDVGVGAGSVAVSGAGTGAIGLSGAGVGTENFVQVDICAYIDGDGADGIHSQNITVHADDSSGISARAGAASLAIAAAGTVGGALSIGVAQAHNEVDNTVEASIKNADDVTTATAGTVDMAATSRGKTLFGLQSVTPAELDDAAVAGDYNPDEPPDPSHPDTEDEAGDASIVTRMRAEFSNKGAALSETVRVSTLDTGQGWVVADAKNNTTYVIRNQDDILTVSKTTIEAVAVAASVALGFGGTAGIALSGAGANATNVITTDTNAFIENSALTEVGDVDLDAQSSSSVVATVIAASAAVGGGGTVGVGVSIGAATTHNFIGFTDDGSADPAEVQAYLHDASIVAIGALTATATADQSIGSIVFAGSAALAAGGTVGVAASGAGVSTVNKIGTQVKAYIDGDGATGITADSVTLQATDTSTICAFAGALSLAASVAGTVAVSVSVGVALANNTISNDVEAYIRDADMGVTTTAGPITICAAESAHINALTGAASTSAAGSLVGIALSGAGADASNTILTSTKAYVEDSILVSAGDVDLNATSDSTVKAAVLTASSALSGGFVAASASIGVALARNFIGWYADAGTTATYTTADTPESVSPGQTVKIAEGVRAGDVYRYIGQELLEPASAAENYLLRQDYSNRDLWQQVNLSQQTAGAAAFIIGSDISAAGDLTVHAYGNETIVAAVMSGSAALSGGAVGAAVSGAGAAAENTITTEVSAFIDGQDHATIVARDVSLTAHDDATITAIVAALGLSASLGGDAMSCAIGTALAWNEISNLVTAAIVDADLTTTEDIAVVAREDATIAAWSAASSFAAAFALASNGVAVSGAGAMAMNTIVTVTDAHVQDSALVSAGGIKVEAQDTATITATIGAFSFATAVGGNALGAAVGASYARNVIGHDTPADPGQADVRAYVTGGTINATGTLTVAAIASETIDAIVEAQSAAVAAGVVALAQGGAFAAADNLVALHVLAYLAGDGALAITAGSVDVTAADTSTIQALAGASAVAESVGLVAGSVSVGGAMGRSVIRNCVKAYLAVPLSGVITTAGDITVQATEDVTSDGYADAAAHAGSLGIGLSLSGAGAAWQNVLTPQATAYLAEGTHLVSAGDVNVVAHMELGGNSVANGTATSSGIAVAASVADVQAAPVVTASTGPQVDIDAVHDVNIRARYNTAAGEDPPAKVLRATSNGSAGALLKGILAGAEAYVASSPTVTASVGAASMIDGTGMSNHTTVNVQSQAFNRVDATATGNVDGLFASGGNSGTKADVDVHTIALTEVGAGTQVGVSDPLVPSVYNLNVSSDATTDVEAHTAGASGNSLGDALRSLFHAIGDFFTGGDFDGVKVPALLQDGGTVTLVRVSNHATTQIGASSQLTAGNDVSITADAVVVVDADSSMQGKSTFKANAASATDVFVDSDAVVSIADSPEDVAPVRIHATNVLLAADDTLAVDAVASATVQADFGAADVSGMSRVRVGTNTDPSEARVELGNNAVVTALEALTLRALNHQVGDIPLLSRAACKAFGTFASTSNTLSDGTLYVNATVASGAGCVMTGKAVEFQAKSTCSLDRESQGTAETVATKIVKVAREVVRKIVKWLPWPLNYLVRYVTETVFDVIEVIDPSATNSKVAGDGPVITDSIALRGTINLLDREDQTLIVNTGLGGGIVTSGNIGAQLVDAQIVVDDVGRRNLAALSFIVPRGNTSGDAVVYVASAPRVTIVNNTDRDLKLGRIDIAASQSTSANAASVQYDTYATPNEYPVVNTWEEDQHGYQQTSLVDIANHGTGDIIFTQSISNVSGVMHIVNSGGDIVAQDSTVVLEAGDAGALSACQASVILSAPSGRIGTADQRLRLFLIRGDRMPDGSVSTVPARVNATAFGDVVLEVTGQLKIQDPDSAAPTLDQIEFNVLSSAGQVDVIALQGVGLLYALTDDSITVTDRGIDGNGDFFGTTYTGALRFENSGPGTATISGTEAWAVEFSVGQPIQVARDDLPCETYTIESISGDYTAVTVATSSPLVESGGELTGTSAITFAGNVSTTLSLPTASLSPADTVRLSDDTRSVTPVATTFAGAVIISEAGTWDGFVADDTVTVTGSLSNDGAYRVLSVSDTELALADALLTDEVDSSGVTMVCDRTVTFAALAADTISLSRGSWLTDGFSAGDAITVAGSERNNGDYQIASVSADGRLLTLTESVLSSEAIASPRLELTGDRTVTFTASAITLSRGDWTADGFVAGDAITVAGTASNDGRYQVLSVSPDHRILQLTTSTLSSEVTSSPVLAITGAPTVTFTTKALSDGEITELHSELAFTTTEIVRSTGDWNADGLSAGDTIVVSIAEGHANDGEYLIESISADGATLALHGATLTPGTVSHVSITSYPTVACDGSTVTLSRGAWIAEGFNVGDDILLKAEPNHAYYQVASLSADGKTLTLSGATLTHAALRADRVAVTKTTMGVSRGNWSDERFAEQDVIHVDGFSGSANGEHRVLSVSSDAMVLTITSDGVEAETQMASSADVSIYAGGAPTIQRDAGDWLTDGFEAGQWIVVSGSHHNNHTYLIDSLSETTLTLTRGTGSQVTDEVKPAGVSIVAYEPHVSVVGTGTSSREVPTTTTVFSSDVRDVVYQTLSTAGDMGNVTINATGDLIADSVHAPFGTVLMTATESIAFVPAADITGLYVTLSAGDDVSVNATSTISALVSIHVKGDAGNLDPGEGTTIDIAGTLAAPFVHIAGDADQDTFLISRAPSLGITLVEGQDAGDDIQISAANWQWAPIVVFGDYADANLDAFGTLLSIASSQCGVGGPDTITTTGAGFVVAFGGAGDDLVSTGAGAHFIIGDEGHVVLDESGRVSEIHSTDQACGGSDTVSVGVGNGVVFGGGGNDLILDSLSTLTPDAAHSRHVFVGDNGRATLADGRVIEVTTTDFLAADDPSSQSDQIVGGVRADVILGGNHADNLQGGGGDDLILGDNGRVVWAYDEPEGAGRIVAVETLACDCGGPDTIQGDAGDDTIYGQYGNDHVIFSGNALGHDRLFENGQDSSCVNDSHDLLDLSGFGFPIRLNLSSETKQIVSLDSLSVTLNSDTAFEAVIGSAFADEIVGNDRDNSLDARNGNDYVNGVAGDDELLGGEGDDIVSGGTGSDMLVGDAGDDVLVGEDGDDEIHGSAGRDMMSGGAGRDTMYGESDADTMDGGDDNDSLLGGPGDDVLFGGSGMDRVEGQDGDDQMHGNDGDDELFGGEGNDTIDGSAGDDRIEGNAGDDTLRGSGGVDIVFGQEGDDAISGGDDGDYLDGGIGDDTLDGGQGDDQILGNAGDDVLLGRGGNDTLDGDAGHDEIDGGAGDDVADGGDDPDSIRGGFGDDILRGGLGNDSIDGESGSDIVDGNEGDDTISGGQGNDTLRGGADSDNVNLWDTAAGSQTLIDGGDGNDTISFGNGTLGDCLGFVHVNGGRGVDRLLLDDSASGGQHVYVVEPGSVGRDGLAPLVDYSEIEALSLTGGTQPDRFEASACATTSYVFDGGQPTGPAGTTPGDVLDVDLAGLTLVGNPPQNVTSGRYDLGTASIAFQDFESIDPLNDNSAPIVAQPIADMATTWNSEDQVIDLSVVFVDPDGDDLTFAATSDTPGCVSVSVVGTDLILSYLPDQHGNANIVVTATDPDNAMVSDEFTVTVSPGKRSFTIDLGQPDGDVLVALQGPELVAARGSSELFRWPAEEIEMVTVSRPLGDADDVVFSGDWSVTGTRTVNAHFCRVVQHGTTSVPFRGPMDWQNVVSPHDVNADGVVALSDAQLVMDQLESRTLLEQSGRLVDAASVTPFPMQFYDVNGDGCARPLDALLIINRVHAGAAPEGEGASQVATARPQMDSWDSDLESVLDDLAPAISSQWSRMP